MLARLLKSTVDPMRKGKWNMVSVCCLATLCKINNCHLLTLQINQQINQEHAKVKAIQRTLQDISLDLQNTKFAHKLRSQLSDDSNVNKDPSAWFKPDPDIWTPPPKDPDVWGPPKPPPPVQQVGRRATTTSSRRTAGGAPNSGRPSTIPQSTARNGTATARNTRGTASTSNSARGGANGRIAGRKLSTSNSINNNNNIDSKDDDATAAVSNGSTADGDASEQQATEEERKFQPNNHIEAELVDILGKYNDIHLCPVHVNNISITHRS